MTSYKEYVFYILVVAVLTLCHCGKGHDGPGYSKTMDPTTNASPEPIACKGCLPKPAVTNQ